MLIIVHQYILEIVQIFGTAETELSINFTKANTTFSLSLYYNGDEGYLYVNKTNIFKFTAHNNIPWYEYCLGSVLKEFSKDEISEI